jgi:hypothetical protein
MAKASGRQSKSADKRNRDGTRMAWAHRVALAVFADSVHSCITSAYATSVFHDCQCSKGRQ